MPTNKTFIGRHSHTFDTLENFNAKAPVLESGELVVMKDGSNLYFKVGCEKTSWSSLPKYEFLKSYTTGSENGTISINGTNVAVKGLGSAAYKNIEEIMSGNSSTATKLKTARTIALTGSVTGSGSFDGSDNLTITTTTNHTHNLLSNLYSSRPESANITPTGSGGMTTFKSTTSMTTGKPSSDGTIMHFYWDNTGGYESQLFVHAQSTGVIQHRGMNAGTWGDWITVLDSNNYKTYCLPLSGGTITGATQFNNYLKLNAWSGYGTGTANFWYDANNKFVEIQNATDLKLAGTKVSKEGHTHLYAGSSSAGGSATSAIKLTTSAGSGTQPVYFSDGKPVACTYSLGKSVPSDAVFSYSPGAGLKLTGTTFEHSNSVTAGTAQGDASKTLSFGGTFTIPTVTYDAQGHITGKGTTTMTMPANPNTDTKNTAGSTDTSSKIFLIGATTQASTPQTYSDNQVYAENGQLNANSMRIGESITLQYNTSTESLDFVFA